MSIFQQKNYETCEGTGAKAETTLEVQILDLTNTSRNYYKCVQSMNGNHI